MNKLMTAIALAIALPGVAHAQAAPAEKPKMECCKTMKDTCACCDTMAGKPASSGGAAPSSDPQAAHDMAPATPSDGHPHH